jgi:hypothetical protein
MLGDALPGLGAPDEGFGPRHYPATRGRSVLVKAKARITPWAEMVEGRQRWHPSLRFFRANVAPQDGS